MDPDKAEVDTRVHVVALPYPGRGHINPMMNLCDQLLSKDDKILITFVVTEEWLGFLSGGSEPPNFNFRTIPNVVPSELVRAADIIGFVDAVLANMEAPFEQLLDRLEPPATMILFDFVLFWVVGVGNRRNIPVASFWTMSAMVFSVFHHFPLLQQNGHYPIGDLSDKGGEVVDYIPGVSPTSLEDLPTVLRHGPSHQSYHTQAFAQISNSQYLLLATVSELESQAIQVLKRVIPIPVYSIGPSIPYPKLKNTTSSSDTDYIQWLEKQSCNSVLYISMGSFLSLGRAQIDEISAGLRISRVPYLWIARDETPRLIKDGCNGEKGLVVPWCDQLRVLSHSSVGGFWTHCGWSSTLEGVLAGVPFLTLPLIMDQLSNSKLIVEDWNVGWKVKKRENNNNGVVYRNDIAELVKRFMDLESDEAKMMRGRARKLRELCQQAIRKGGSSEENISTFVRDIFQHSYP